MTSNKKCSTKDFISKSKSIFGDLYNYSKVQYENNKVKVELICKNHGSFFVRPDTHLTRKAGCQNCARMKTGYLNMNKNWLSDFKSVHGDRYDYSKVNYKGNRVKVEIVCKNHGSFLMKPNAHISQKQGCPKCSEKYNDCETFIITSNIIFGNLYDYSRVKYINSHQKVEIMCKKHGSFLICPKEHINQKQGCPKCGKISMSNKLRKDIKILLNQFNNLNGDLYDYSNVNYVNNNQKIDIICKKHGLFKQSPKSHLRGDGCPKCKSSKGERNIMYFLEKNNIDYIYQKTYYDCISTIGNKLKFDFYLPDYNICVEYDGEQHFKPIDYFGGVESFNRQRERDITKNNYCLENNIKLIRLSFKDYDKIENILNFEIGL